MNVVRFKDGVTLVPSSGGVRILAALWQIAQKLQRDVTVTSGSDGLHSGVDDPHHKGLAFDIRTHGDPDKQQLLVTLINILAETDPNRFYAFIEDEGGDNEHIHAQVRRGTTYP